MYAFSGQGKEYNRYAVHLEEARKINIKKGIVLFYNSEERCKLNQVMDELNINHLKNITMKS